MRLLGALATIAILAGACGGPPRVRFGAGWPSRAGAYADVHRRWTRHALGRAVVDSVIDVDATLKSPEWRTAYVDRIARNARLPSADRDALLAREREASEKALEFELLVSTYSYSANDLKRPHSMWRVALEVDGRTVAPLEIREDRRPRAELFSWFPAMGPFDRAYVVRFPAVTEHGEPLLTDATRRIALVVGSAVVGVELVWASE